MNILLKVGVAAGILITPAMSTTAAPISISGTGQNITGGRDTSYEIISDTTGEIAAPAPSFVITTLGAGWAPSISGTFWVGPTANQALANQPGGDPGDSSDTYRISFSLAGLDPSTARLNGEMMSDNGVAIVLNGNTVFQNGNGLSVLFDRPFGFGIDSGFVSGINTLDFVVANAFGPTGIDVSISGSAIPIGTAVPEPRSARIFTFLAVLLISCQALLKRLRCASRRGCSRKATSEASC